MFKRVPFPLFLVLMGISASLAGCGTVKKGVVTVAEGAGDVMRSTGQVITKAVPRRGADQNKTSDQMEAPEVIVVEQVAETDSEKSKREASQRQVVPGRFSVYPFKRENETADSRLGIFERKRPEGDASDNLKLREKAWTNIVQRTDVRLIGDDRVRIDVIAPMIMSVDEMEYFLLGRAAGEAARAGYDRFSIVFVRYSGSRGLSGFLVPEISMAGGDQWIGSYEDLIAERENQRMMTNFGKFGGKKIEAVVRFVEGSDRRSRETFPATELYLNMLNERLYEGDYPYKN